MTTPLTPAWGDIVPLTTEDWHDLPDIQAPYYVHTAKGHYLHRRTVSGRGIVKTPKTPAKLKAPAFWDGQFTWDAAPIPATIYAQAVHFFRRVWDKYKTEAEVIITQHQETKEYRLFVPTQQVHHGGVRSLYNPRHIDPAYLVIGTFHSHCNFSPFHSSTDEGDARDMDGIHGTIGFVDREVPEMALMYALNGKLFHFSDFTGVVDTSDLSAATSPEWWDRYLVFHQVTDADRPAWVDDDSWDRYMGRYRKPQPTQSVRNVPTPRYTTHQGWDDDDLDPMVMAANGYIFNPRSGSWQWVGSQPLRESREFNARQEHLRALPVPKAKAPTPTWGPSGELLIGKISDLPGDTDYWEDALGIDYVDSLVNTGLFTEEDLDDAISAWPDSGGTEFWEKRMRGKLFRSVAWLRSQGFEVTVKVQDNRPKVVPGQTSIDDQIAGIAT